MTISVIMPNYNGVHILKRCLSKNLETFKKCGITDVIIVDDCSTDDSVEYLATHFPDVRVIQNNENLRFSRVCNRGASVANGDTLFFLNNDMVVTDLDVKAIEERLNSSDTFAISPPIYRETKEGKTINETPTKGFFKGGWLSTENDPSIEKDGDFPILWACGGAMLVKKERFDLLDGFDPLMHPFYCEDVDLCYRAWKRGWTSLHAPIGRCEHQHQATIGSLYTKHTIEAAHLKNKYIFIWKNLTYWPYILTHALTVLIKCLTFQRKDLVAIVNASFKLPQILKYRYNSRPEILSDKNILSQW